ncbi:MAG: hypothetical protein K8M05_08690, partial [Deltaproteobacteria bacterium]|nr:hypothetical protein [Kofleriaceae bacterium]
MSRPIPDAARRLVTSSFGAPITRRALELATAGRVHVVKPPPWPVVARLHVDGGHVVTVHYDPGAVHLRGDCSCPAAGDCEHAAATALVVLAQEESHDEARADVAQQAQVSAWLTGIGQVERDGAAPVPADRVVAYVMDVKEGDVGLTPVAATRLRRGGLSAGQAIAALADPTRGAPRWVDVADLRRIAMLRAVSRAPAEVSRLRVDRIHGELLRELADAGVLFWESTRNDPLRWGAPIVDTLRWRQTGDARFRLGVDADVLIVCARECHYVDPHTMAIGALELGLSAELVHKLTSGPAVPASMRATVDRSLAPLLATARPAAGDAEPLQLRLHAWIDHDDPAVRHWVQLQAEALYGDDHVPLATWDAPCSFARDLVAEGRARARLDELLARLPHGARASTSLELLADARHVAHAIIPALRAEGWTCTLADDFPHEAPVADVTFTEKLLPRADDHAWFSVELGVTIAGRTVPLLPLLLAAIRDGHLEITPGGVRVPGGGGLNVTLPEGELVHVPAERLARWLRPLVELELHGLDDDGALVVPALSAA